MKPNLAIGCSVWMVIALLSTFAAAQGEDKAPQGDATGFGDGPLINIDFTGGSVADYVESIRKAAGDLNVLLAAKEVQGILLPPMRLRAVDILSAFYLIEGEHQVHDGNAIVVDVEPYQRLGGGSRAIYKISGRPVRNRTSIEVHVWSLAELISPKLTAQAILTAIETAEGLLKDGDAAAQIRFHEGTALLIASGTHAQRDAIDRVVKSLREGTEKAASVITRSECETQNDTLRRKAIQETAAADEMRIQFNAVAQVRTILEKELSEAKVQVHEKERIIHELEKRLGERSGK